MTNHYISFLVAEADTAPKTLIESIDKVSKASTDFCQSWLANKRPEALNKSEEAFKLLDHIQNELLRYRDKKLNLPNWSNSPFKVALDSDVGFLLNPAKASQKAAFIEQHYGCGAMPPNSSVSPLKLVVALNKLKHRDTNAVNFTVSTSGEHIFLLKRHLVPLFPLT